MQQEDPLVITNDEGSDCPCMGCSNYHPEKM